jgi:two-component system KDP operon response regulator KdpE
LLWPVRDLVLLDINLPDANGFDVLTAVARMEQYARNDVVCCGQDRRRSAFSMPVPTICVTKPFAAGELLARIRVALRRRTQPDEAVFRSGRLEIDFSARRRLRCRKQSEAYSH